MDARPWRRVSAAAAAALLTALALPLQAHASSAGADYPPTLEQRTSAAAAPRIVADPTSSASAVSRRSSVAPIAAAVPVQVTGVVVTGVTSTGAAVRWDAPSDGSSPITGYHLQLLTSGVVQDELTTDSPTTSAVIFDLQPDTRYEFRIAASNAAGSGDFSVPIPFTTEHWSVARIFGGDRFETAVRVSQDAFPSAGVTLGLVANGLNFPDALASAAAGGTFGGPVLLTRPSVASTAMLDELRALEPDHVFVSGGIASVSETVRKQVASIATVDSGRLAGQSRYGTAAEVSGLWEPNDIVFLASGMNYPDALAGAAAAGYRGAPVLLTSRDALPRETAAALAYHAPMELVILGGAGSVSDGVISQARIAAGSSPSITRLSGQNRYQTAVAISKNTFPGTPRVPVVYLASGTGFADALSGAAAAGFLGGPLLLTSPNSAAESVLEEIKRLDPVRVVILGGPAAVSETVRAQVEAKLR